MRRLVILGSTGSIGESALQVVSALGNEWQVTGLATRANARRVVEQARTLGARVVAVADGCAALEAERLAQPYGIEVWGGAEGVTALAKLVECDMVLVSLVGLAGLQPLLAALESGRQIALATKEVLVAAGELVMNARAAAAVKLLPIDSEHSAIFQCLQARNLQPFCIHDQSNDGQPAERQIARLTLTASGGPFAFRPEVDFTQVTAEQALAHPRWRMGRKVTIDSATMMNKGLELLEARWLFNVPVEQLEVLVHPESIVHSLVTFVDQTQMAQLSQPDMRFPIQYALTWPLRRATALPALDLATQGRLTFERPDMRRFPALRLAREAAQTGGSLPAVLNAADEVAVEAFLDRKISFKRITEVVEEVMSRHDVVPLTSLEVVEEADCWARRQALVLCGKKNQG